ncbi:branched-chain amino acid ABC transporter substrate-binding protein [Rhodovibrio salinarum]|uniref:Branched-chain amino acid ABC transporter substrate-binding protein n=1 Tax=Rhodovibrio salinarum TaxID=1087 RepID=A0A934QJV7_9PROT|nr:branched-chain amino acid ABC transporter substrate-binding protein [Rhodovibrio salinarum]MBK1698223.1 branched-chain amino acid ABC transporter substrate-binding protein [Rhodovibrio salinarum]
MKLGTIGAVTSAALALALGVASAPAMAKDKVTVTVAFIGPLSGGVSSVGLGGRNSAKLAVDLRNQDPEAKYEYELLALDDECKPNVGVQVATRAASNRDVVAGVTHYCSAVAMGTVDVYHKFGMPAVVWGAVLPDVTYGNSYPEVHRVNGTMINQNEVAAEFMTDQGYESWVIIHDTTDYGQGHQKYFSEALEKNGGEILATFGVTADQQDFTAELTQAKSLNPDVIYFGGLTPIGVRIRSQMEKLGIDAQFEGTSGIVSDAYIQGAGDLAEGTVAFIEGAPIAKLPGGQYFQEQYDKANFDSPPEAYGPFAFAAMNLVLDKIEEVGPDRRKVRDALNAVEGRDSIVGEITFDDHGQNAVALITKFVVQDGKWVVWEDSEYASGERKLSGM